VVNAPAAAALAAPVGPPGSLGIDALLAHARSGLLRIGVRDAAVELTNADALLVDIRPAAQRAVEGEVHPAYRPLVIERNVLEWRLDPRSDARLDIARFDLRVLVLCQEGYTSSLAAAALQQIGLTRATDVDGGFAAWRQAGLPVADRPIGVPA
jgi:rhodanese-related sulfurtransferase